MNYSLRRPLGFSPSGSSVEKFITFICSALLVVALAACGTADKLSAKAIPLKRIQPSISVYPVWYRQPQSRLFDAGAILKPVVKDERFFIAESKGLISAMRVTDGQYLWQVKIPSLISGGIGYGQGLLFIGTSDGDVLALRVEDGAEQWRINVSSEVLTPPVADEGVVVVRAIDGKMYGLDIADGRRLWVYESSVPTLTLRGVSAPVVANGQVFSGLANGKLVAVSLRDGKVLWENTVAVPEGRSELERLVDIDADPVLKSGVLYAVAYNGRMVAVSVTTGRTLWSRKISSHSGMSVDDENIYISDDESNVLALDRKNGSVIWKQENLSLRLVTSPVLYKDMLVLGDREGYLHWLSQKDGTLLARYKVGDGGVKVRPVVDAEAVYTRDQDGTLVALRTSDK